MIMNNFIFDENKKHRFLDFANFKSLMQIFFSGLNIYYKQEFSSVLGIVTGRLNTKDSKIFLDHIYRN